jgi:hypothetical protein
VPSHRSIISRQPSAFRISIRPFQPPNRCKALSYDNLVDTKGFQKNKCLTDDYFRFAAHRGQSEVQFRFGLIAVNGDGIPLNEEHTAIYFGFTSSNGCLDQKYFMISPNGEFFFKTQQL